MAVYGALNRWSGQTRRHRQPLTIVVGVMLFSLAVGLIKCLRAPTVIGGGFASQ
jgi:hypothetical protein